MRGNIFYTCRNLARRVDRTVALCPSRRPSWRARHGSSCRSGLLGGPPHFLVKRIRRPSAGTRHISLQRQRFAEVRPLGEHQWLRPATQQLVQVRIDTAVRTGHARREVRYHHARGFTGCAKTWCATKGCTNARCWCGVAALLGAQGNDTASELLPSKPLATHKRHKSKHTCSNPQPARPLAPLVPDRTQSPRTAGRHRQARQCSHPPYCPPRHLQQAQAGPP